MLSKGQDKHSGLLPLVKSGKETRIKSLGGNLVFKETASDYMANRSHVTSSAQDAHPGR